MDSEITQDDHPIAHVIVEEVPNSQNPRDTEHEYNPFVSQSQPLSQSEPSIQASLPGPSNQASLPGPSNQASLPGPSNQASLPGPSNQASLPGPSKKASLPGASKKASLPGPSKKASLPGPSKKASLPGPSKKASLPGPPKKASLPRPTKKALRLDPSNKASLPGPSNQAPQSLIEFTAETTSEPKRRGRPPRSSTLHLKPTRGSQRTRKCPKVLNYDSFRDSSWQWTERDKTLFLAGCLEVGIEDIEGLKRYLPHKTENDIKSQVSIWKELATRRVEQHLAAGEEVCGVEAEAIKNLDEWINYFKEKAKTSDASTFLMSNYFSILSEYGVFPSPEECGGIDMRAMYRYLHCMMNGVPPYGLNRVTTNVLIACLDNVMEKLDDPNLIQSMEDHLYDQPSKPDDERFGKTYSRKGKNASAKAIDTILSDTIMNPLNLPENAMIKVFEDEEDSEED